ncbi:MAG: hypothetical protein BAJALOKI3v1_210007 [Promethearchaeota archaeon]|nr:MAG: hypothetical protein BAJALOKI3v1_210007 [Candidatus Lokiarchaeota archaeon]
MLYHLRYYENDLKILIDKRKRKREMKNRELDEQYECRLLCTI